MVPGVNPNDTNKMNFQVKESIPGTGFKQSIQAFIKLYCNDSGHKGNLTNFIRSEEYRKLKKVMVVDHQERVKELIHYSKFQHESSAGLNKGEEKKLLFEKFPLL